MYKVFLVDDEIVIRENIRTSFPWDSSGFVLSGEAPDGEIALSLIKEIRPDILITDIRMPFMDGLELCRLALSDLPWLKVVILSGFDEFAYARKALSLGVKEYLLKPLSAHELESALRRIAAQIDEERRRQDDYLAIKTQLEESSALIRDQFLGSIIKGIQDEDKRAALFLRARELNINLLARHYRVMLIAPKQMEINGGVPLRAVIARLKDSRPLGSLHQCQMEGLTALLFLDDSPEALEEHVFLFAQAVKHETENLPACALRIAIGAMVNSVYALQESYRSAMRLLYAMGEHFTQDATRIMDSAELQLRMGEVLSLSQDVSLYDALRFAPVSSVRDVLNDYFQRGADQKQSLMMMNYLFVESMRTAARIIAEQGLNAQETLPESFEPGGETALISNPEDMAEIAEQALTRALTLRDLCSLSRYGEVVRQACAFIEQQFNDPNLSLGDAARHVHLSTNHFCTVFSQETNTTFIEHLTRLRLERACELLENTSLRSSEIAPRIGYRDPYYFSWLFKKNTGMSPRDYRLRHKKAEP